MHLIHVPKSNLCTAATCHICRVRGADQWRCLQAQAPTPEALLLREACYRALGEGFGHPALASRVDFAAWYSSELRGLLAVPPCVPLHFVHSATPVNIVVTPGSASAAFAVLRAELAEARHAFACVCPASWRDLAANGVSMQGVRLRGKQICHRMSQVCRALVLCKERLSSSRSLQPRRAPSRMRMRRCCARALWLVGTCGTGLPPELYADALSALVAHLSSADLVAALAAAQAVAALATRLMIEDSVRARTSLCDASASDQGTCLCG